MKVFNSSVENRVEKNIRRFKIPAKNGFLQFALFLCSSPLRKTISTSFLLLLLSSGTELEISRTNFHFGNGY